MTEPSSMAAAAAAVGGTCVPFVSLRSCQVGPPTIQISRRYYIHQQVHSLTKHV